LSDTGYVIARYGIDIYCWMNDLWLNPRDEKESQEFRDLAARILVETDTKKLDTLIEELTQLIAVWLRMRSPD
jgi:hypothetical protein